ncbi:MAG TPA: hypothetical protein VHC86_01295 [Opitutaceae bacterium]|nr:hypothetical protein [Opitutaceae bacterium]
MASLPRLLPLAASALLALALAGCAHTEDTFANAVNAGERPVAMEGKATFFGGQIAATLTISRGVGHGRTRGGGGGGRRHRDDGDSGAGGFKADTAGMDDDQQMAYIRARGALGSPLPPVTLRLQVANQGPQIVQIEVQEVNSDLGNFAVEPSLLSVAPGQSASPDPMISQLGVTSDDIPVKVTLAIKGKAESQTIQVKALPPPPASPPAPPQG